MRKIYSFFSILLSVTLLMACNTSSLESDIEILKENGWSNFLLSDEPGITIINLRDLETEDEFRSDMSRVVVIAKGTSFFDIEVAMIYEFISSQDARDYFNENPEDDSEDRYLFIRGNIVYYYNGSNPSEFSEILSLNN